MRRGRAKGKKKARSRTLVALTVCTDFVRLQFQQVLDRLLVLGSAIRGRTPRHGGSQTIKLVGKSLRGGDNIGDSKGDGFMQLGRLNMGCRWESGSLTLGGLVESPAVLTRNSN
jgi:hypothetical protein